MKRLEKGENKTKINKREADSDRRQYLQQLATEFQVSPSIDAKYQVLANLANFAYDPYNYDFLREAKVLDIFIGCLKSDDTKFIQFSSGGICNLCIDPINAKYILKNNGIQFLVDLLKSENEVILLNCVTSLIYLTEYDKDISATVLPYISQLETCKSQRLKNLINIFIEDNSGQK